MIKKKSKSLLDSVESLIGHSATIEGAVKTDKTVRIDGKINGNIIAEGVIVGEKAEITGDIDTKVIVIAGLIKGNINASETIEILPQAKVFGDIKTNILTIAEGAHFYGNSSMTIKETTVD